MKSFLFPFVSLLLFALFTAGCKHEPVIPPGGNPNDSGDTTGTVQPCDSNRVYFVNTIQPLINSNCAIPGCHDVATQSDGVDLSSYQRIKSTADVPPGNPGGSDLYEVLVETDPTKLMPPPSSGITLTSAEIQAIRDWIQQGAINDSCDANAGNCDTAMVSFSVDIQPIIGAYCQGCHSGSAPQGGISLSNYQEISAQATNGNLRGVVEYQNGFVPMPYNSSPLNDCDIALIRNWVLDGAPNN
jgi:hypothetical protein